MNQTSALSNQESFQANMQQPAYAGDYLISFHDGIVLMTELDELTLDMCTEDQQ